MDFKKIIKCTLLSVILSILLSCILGIFVFFLNIPDKTINTLILILSALSVFFAAFILAKNVASLGLVNGLILGAVYSILLVIITALVKGSLSFGTENITRILITLAAGMLGGVLGINTHRGE